jgi:hypothetical protein
MFRLFRRRKAKDEEVFGDFDEEAEAVVSIKTICDTGASIVRHLPDSGFDRTAQLARYERIRDACIARVDKLADEYYRGVAIQHIIEMCAAAGEMGVARALLLAVHDDFTREQILASVPALKTDPPPIV